MNKDNLSDIIGAVDDDIIAEAEAYRVPQKRRKNLVLKIVAVAACVCIIAAVVLQVPKFINVSPVYAKSFEAEYPSMPQYPDPSDVDFNNDAEYDEYLVKRSKWRLYLDSQLDQPRGYDEGFNSFCYDSLDEFLTNNRGDNVTYSPLNIYMALSMLAQTAEGNSRQELFNLLGVDNIYELKTKAKALWNANYCDDGTVKSILANSVWLNDKVGYNGKTLQALADHYYASSYMGDMGSPGFNKALQDWLNKQTGGLLGDQVKNVNLEADVVMALASTVYYKARWESEFQKNNNIEEVFCGARGDKTCDFMTQSMRGNYFWDDNFSAVFKQFENSGGMWFILPDEGVSTDEVLKSTGVMDLILSKGEWDRSKELIINMRVPKFDVVSDRDVSPILKKLGVNDVFDSKKADFSPVTEEISLYLSKVQHATRVTVDEEGCTAAAFTVELICGSSMPPRDEVDFILNRPFVFAITGASGAPLFIGIVNNV